MTLTEILAALLIVGLFLAGLSQSVFPAITAWDRTNREYRAANSIHFVAASFRKECVKENRNIENWKKAVAAVPELVSYEITEIRQGDLIRALRLSCIVADEHIEVIGLCTP
ncbi:hypothetical protein AGMMS49942_23240 [Spirochaetia bacterium]|nr:hypothetical protein AGMMS49942_23240 [Spirochaetia bacterium]